MNLRKLGRFWSEPQSLDGKHYCSSGIESGTVYWAHFFGELFIHEWNVHFPRFLVHDHAQFSRSVQRDEK